MAFKIFSAIVAAGLLVAYLAPVAVKLREVSLGIVILIGLALMAIDIWQSFKEKED